MSATATSAHTPLGAFASVLNAAVSSAASSLERQTSAWTDKLEDIASGDTTTQVGVAAAEAKLTGHSPFRAAVRKAWDAGSPAVKAAIVTAVVASVLLLVVSPVLLLVYLLSLLVVVAVTKAASRKR